MLYKYYWNINNEVLIISREEENEGYKVIHLVGNHEDTILKSRNDITHKANWMFNGGERTVYSFFRHQNKFEEIIDYWEEFYKEKWLFDFFEEMPHIVESENCIFVHAGIDFSKSLENQDEAYVVWTRDDWYMKNNTGKIVFYGHTPQNEVISYNNCFNLDSGTFNTNVLNLKQRHCIDWKMTGLKNKK